MDTRIRIEEKILDYRAYGVEPTPHDVAMELIDDDVSRGEYEGCSSELELAASEYIAIAEKILKEDQ